MLWEVDIYPAAAQPDRRAQGLRAEAADLGLGDAVQVATAYGYLVQGAAVDRAQIERGGIL